MSKSKHPISRRKFLYGGLAVGSTALIAGYLEMKGLLPGGEYHHLRRRLLLYSRPVRRIFEPGWDGTRGGWEKYSGNPVLGGSLGTCFDMCVLKEQDNKYRMWFSWRPRESIAITESHDGISWSHPTIVLRATDNWDDDVNRPWVIRTDRGYEMWFTGQTVRQSSIGHAVSQDGIQWTRTSTQPVMVPDQPWEGPTVMCPSVIWDAAKREYRMWYSAGQQYEPVAMGYATSTDGMKWVKRPDPVFTHGRPGEFDERRVGGGNVVERDGWYLMFYIGYSYITDAAIGLARSRDGITGWERHPQNPIIGPGRVFTEWDSGSVYKPSALVDNERWMVWYNACRSDLEQIGLAVHNGLDLGFGSA